MFISIKQKTSLISLYKKKKKKNEKNILAQDLFVILYFIIKLLMCAKYQKSLFSRSRSKFYLDKQTNKEIY